MLLLFEKVGVRHWWKLWFLLYIFVLSYSFMFHMCLQKTHTLFTLRTGWGAIWGVCLGSETRHSASWASAAKLALRPNTEVWGNNTSEWTVLCFLWEVKIFCPSLKVSVQASSLLKCTTISSWEGNFLQLKMFLFIWLRIICVCQHITYSLIEKFCSP